MPHDPIEARLLQAEAARREHEDARATADLTDRAVAIARQVEARRLRIEGIAILGIPDSSDLTTLRARRLMETLA